MYGTRFLLIILIPYLLAALVSAFTLPYVVNYWSVYFDNPVTMLWWQGVLLSLIPGVGYLGVIATIITFVVSMLL